ncbi:hypothetical protein [Microvirga sesbaniae]|uniref:hypothetical protein n=1 Tax=Microvirga sesbaniae TaxID=681392 RepID=UPI0021C84BBF|nr:hypothetical protein [Microvirga sp. HBU67692]
MLLDLQRERQGLGDDLDPLGGRDILIRRCKLLYSLEVLRLYETALDLERALLVNTNQGTGDRNPFARDCDGGQRSRKRQIRGAIGDHIPGSVRSASGRNPFPAFRLDLAGDGIEPPGGQLNQQGRIGQGAVAWFAEEVALNEATGGLIGIKADEPDQPVSLGNAHGAQDEADLIGLGRPLIEGMEDDLFLGLEVGRDAQGLDLLQIQVALPKEGDDLGSNRRELYA